MTSSNGASTTLKRERRTALNTKRPLFRLAADQAIVFCRLGRRADHLPHVEIVAQQLEWEFVQRNPRLCVHLRIFDSDRELHVIAVRAMKAFFDPKITAVRTPGFVYPGPFIRASRVNNERRVVHPLADRIPEPARLR